MDYWIFPLARRNFQILYSISRCRLSLFFDKFLEKLLWEKSARHRYITWRVIQYAALPPMVYSWVNGLP